MHQFREMPDDFMPDTLVLKAEHGNLAVGCDLRTFEGGPDKAISLLRRSIWMVLEIGRMAKESDETGVSP